MPVSLQTSSLQSSAPALRSESDQLASIKQKLGLGSLDNTISQMGKGGHSSGPRDSPVSKASEGGKAGGKSGNATSQAASDIRARFELLKRGSGKEADGV